MAPRAEAWAALLHCGRDAALCGRTALWFWGIERLWPQTVEVAIPNDRRVCRQDAVAVRLRASVEEAVHPAAVPRRLRLEEALLDVVDGQTRADAVLTPVLRAIQQRTTTPERSAAALGRRTRRCVVR